MSPRLLASLHLTPFYTELLECSYERANIVVTVARLVTETTSDFRSTN
jgi:hypothetical protein